MSDLVGNHIVGFPTRWLKLYFVNSYELYEKMSIGTIAFLILSDTCISCTPDREILHFTPCEKFLSHPRYLTPVAPCVQMFFFNTDCIGRHVISSLSAHVTMTSKVLNQNGGRRDFIIFLGK